MVYQGTFDMTLLVVTAVWLMMNVGLTFILKPDIFHNIEFWALQVNMVHSLYNHPALCCLALSCVISSSREVTGCLVVRRLLLCEFYADRKT